MTLTQRKRVSWIDIAKGIGILLVILGHYKPTPRWMTVVLYSFHMPLFFILSGIMFNPEKYPRFIDFLKQRLKTMLVPYFILSFIAVLITDVFFYTDGLIRASFGQHILSIILGYRLHKYYYSMWFITALFLAELLTYIILKRIKKTNQQLWIVIALNIVGFLLPRVIKGFFWSLDLVPMVTSFVLFGFITKDCYIKMNNLRIKQKILGIVASSFITVGLAYLNYIEIGKNVDMYAGRYGNYFYYLIPSIAGSCMVIIFSQLLNKERLLEYFGRNSLIIYAFQNNIFIPYASMIIKMTGTRGALRHGLVLLLVLLMAVVMVEFINRCIPFAIGRSKRIKEA